MRLMNYNDLSGKSVLLLGKTRALQSDEFDALLRVHNVTLVSVYDSTVALIIEGRMMNPYEQSEAEHLYETQDAPIVELSEIERWLCQSIEPNRLLMSLKLSRNQERLVDFLQNPYITNELYFKLLALYDWQNEELFDTDTNRDVTASIIGRFYKELERNHNVQYAMSGLAHLIERYGTTELIDAIACLEPIAKVLRDRSTRSLSGVLDVIALHPQTSEAILRKLIDERATLLAYREPLSLEEELLALKSEEINTILAQNKTLSQQGTDFLERDFPQLIAANTIMSEERFERLIEAYGEYLASNQSCSISMQQRLFALGQEAIIEALAANPKTHEEILEVIFDSGKHRVALGSNSSLSPEKLEILYASQEYKVLEALAANTATPIDLLYQLSLDRRFERSVKTNPAFGKHIQTHNIGWH